ncbi:MAG: methionyl-tRNA formyltransferase [Candidatus Omnitrophica bacterium]|nr:methionyl-tRNA formyltransferase [Candidatus Omnitrophota bacterium]
MKIVFLGFQTWGYAALKGLLDSSHQVSLVVTHPQGKGTYKDSFLDQSVKQLAKATNIPVIESRKANSLEIKNKIKDVAPDVIISSDWETWISPGLTALAKKGAINVHDALLPKYAGFSPVNWAVINGEKFAGVTVHYIEEAFDQGKIILQEEVPIEEDDTVIEVLEKIFEKTPEITLKSLDLIEKDKVEAKEQDLSQASFYHKILEEDCEINWHSSPRAVYNFIRALSDPFPNAFTYFQGQKLKIKKASNTNKVYCGIPGRLVCREEKGVVVLSGSKGVNQPQGIVIEEIQDSQGKTMSAKQYFLKLGTRLGKASKIQNI